jgi:hypothetical protein
VLAFHSVETFILGPWLHNARPFIKKVSTGVGTLASLLRLRRPATPPCRPRGHRDRTIHAGRCPIPIAAAVQLICIIKLLRLARPQCAVECAKHRHPVIRASCVRSARVARAREGGAGGKLAAARGDRYVYAPMA